MSVECFIDTNVFIYQLEATDPHKSRVANRLIRRGMETGNACISFQVVQECLNTVLRKAEIPLDTRQTHDYLEAVLQPLFRVPASLALYAHALDFQARYRYSFYDSLIIAAAVAAGCETLYSEDMQDGQRLEGLVITNPF